MFTKLENKRAYDKKWRLRNLEYARERGRIWSRNNREKMYSYGRKWRLKKGYKPRSVNKIQDLKEYRRNWMVKWRLENPKLSSFKRKVSNLKRRLNGRVSAKTIQAVYERNIKNFGTLTCYLCLSPMFFNESSIEHSIPIARGGTHDEENLGVAHRICNLRKKIKTLQEYKGENLCQSLLRHAVP